MIMKHCIKLDAVDELDEIWERSGVLKNIVKLEILQSAPNDPKPN